MAPGTSEYTRRSAVLLQATERFEESLGEPRTREAATQQLLSAAEKDNIADVRLGFKWNLAYRRPRPFPAGFRRFCSIYNQPMSWSPPVCGQRNPRSKAT